MIVFDGISLNSVASVKIKDVQVFPIEYDEVTRPRAIRAGSDFVRSRAGTRKVQITFGLLDDNIVNRQAALMAISQWAKTDKEYRLEILSVPNKYLSCVCTSKPEPSTRMWWESKLRLVFTCYENPYWTSVEEKSVACGTAAFIFGDAPPLMRIERTLASAASNQAYGLDGRQMGFSTIPAGDMVIDLNRQIAYVGNTSIMQYYDINSRFLIPRSGSVTVIGTGTVKYRERWQ